jgi:transposase
VKILTWETDGFSIYYKQLQKGTYEFTPNDVNGKGAVISYSQLLLILEGISLSRVHYRPRYKKNSELSTI